MFTIITNMDLSDEFVFACALRVTVYCMSYELLFGYESQISFPIRVTNYGLLQELRVIFFM